MAGMMLARAAGYWRDREPPRAGRDRKLQGGSRNGSGGAAAGRGRPHPWSMAPLDSPGRDPCTVRSSVVGSATAAGHGVTEP